MKVVFFEEVEGTALVGEVREVKRGFARNFLLPRGLAGPVTKENMGRAERLAEVDRIRQDKLDGAAHGIAAKIDGAELEFEARVGEQGRMFGSITARDIAGKLSELAGEQVDHRQVLLGQNIRTVGRQELRVRLTRNVIPQISVEVRAEGGEVEEAETTISEVVAELEAEEAAEREEQEAARQASAEGDDEASEATDDAEATAAEDDEVQGSESEPEAEATE